MAIDWLAGGYGVLAWHVRRVDPATWAKGEELSGVRSISVERSCDGDAPLLESAEVGLDVNVDSEQFMGWLGISATCEQSGQVELVDLATVWCERTRSTIERGADARTFAGKSVLWPCEKCGVWDVSDINGYAPAGCDGAQFAALMLREATPAPVTVDGSFTLDEHIVFDRDTSVLEAAWAILRAGGFSISLAGDGTIRVEPRREEPTLELDKASASILLPSIDVDADVTDVPNVYVAIDGESFANATNDDPTSPVSTVARGWQHVRHDTSPVRVNGETLSAYAARRLEEESTVSRSLSYSREWWPGVTVGDVVRGSLASVGLDGDMRVTRQRIECGKGILVEEDAQREVMLWRRS